MQAHAEAAGPGQPAPHGANNTELSWDDALRMAMAMHRDMRLDGAETLYRRLLQLQPRDANVQHFLGMLLYQRGRPAERAEAIGLMTASVLADPTVAAWHNNLGNALLDGGEHEAAALAYQRCSALDPGNAEAFSNLGCLLRSLGRQQEAMQAFERALALQPDFVNAHLNYATLLATSGGDLKAAFAHYARALELQPRNPVARKRLGVVYAQNGRLDDAARVFREWVDEEPENVQARHHLAAVTGQDVPARACDAYVVDVFDRFAGSFDQRLALLEYQAPRLVGEWVAGQFGAPGPTREVLDAGAGTGLCGSWLAPYARRLVGVDLSPAMLDKARRRGGYDELEVAELVAYLRGQPAVFDLIVSADTLCYFGALDEAIRAAAAALRPGGWLVFTVEALADDDGLHDHRLQPHGRYAHAQHYLRRTLADSALADAALDAVVLRKEAGADVHGWLVSARLPGALAVSPRT